MTNTVSLVPEGLLDKIKGLPKATRIKTLEELNVLQEILDLTQTLEETVPISARLLLLQQGQVSAPKCMQCNNPVRWSKKKANWDPFCSTACKSMALYGVQDYHKATKIKEARQKTMIDRYGYAHPSLVPEVQNKRAATFIQKYGVDNPFKSQTILEQIKRKNRLKYGFDYAMSADVNRAKKNRTMLEKYGVTDPNAIPGTLEKQKATCFKNYGKTNPMHVTRIRLEKSLARKKTRYGDLLEKLQSRDFWVKQYLEESKTLQKISEELGVSDSVCGRFLHLFAPDIKIRDVYYHSNEELELRSWIQSLLPEYEVGPSTLSQIASEDLSLPQDPKSRLTLDIYISHLKLAFEYNGLYWHSSLFHPSTYHLDKTKAAERLGIRLIHVWSDDWNLNRPLMESKIKMILGLCDAQRIHARQCSIIIPTQEEKRRFYNKNHIKGDGMGFITYALEHQTYGQLAMFTVQHTKIPGVLDLNRFAVDLDFKVPGAFSKLLAHFKRNIKCSKLITYADRCWSQGNVYLKNGFTLTHETPPAFYGVEYSGTKRVSRRAYTHPRLAVRFPRTYDPTKSQLENLALANVPVVYDCGNYAFQLELDNQCERVQDPEYQ